MKQLMLVSRLCLLVLSAWLITGCGGGSDSGTPPPPPVVNTQPNPFSFTAQSAVDPEAIVTSNSITVSGINAAASISIQNGEYSVNNGDFTTAAATVNNAAQIRVRHQAASQYTTSQTTTLTIGGISANFVSTTRNQPASGNETPPQAAIVFPWTQSKTSAGTITVRGTASSRDGISALIVNGVAADVQSQSVAAQRVSTQSISSQDNDESDEEEFEWTADVEIEPYSNVEIVVSVEDQSGNRDDEAATVQTSTLQAPLYIAFDAEHDRLIGIMDNRDVVAIELTDFSYQTLAVVGEPTQFSLDPDGSRLLYSRYVGTTLYLFALNLASGEFSTLQTYEPQLDEGTQVTAVHTRLDATNQLVYVLLRLAEADADYATDMLYRVDLADESIRLLSQSSLDDTPFLPLFEIVWHNESLLGLSQNGKLIEVERVTGDRHELLSLDNSPFKLAAGTDHNELYVAGFKNILKVNLSGLETTVLSEETPSLEHPTAQVSDMTMLDENTLLVADSSFEVVLQVNTETGDRSALVSSGIGSGRGLLSPQYLTFTDNSDILYVLDDGQNAAESLFAIDLTTGNRSQLSEINRPFNTYPSGLYYHDDNDALLVGLSDAIWSASLADGSLSVISDSETGNGVDIGTLAGGDFDTSTGTLYMAQFALENGVLLIDVSTGERSLLEFDGSAGQAGIITGLNDTALDVDNQQLFIASQSQSAIYRLDLETLETELLLDQCQNSIGQNILDIDVSGIQKIRFDANKQRLLILASQLASYDLENQECRIIGQSPEYYNALPLENGTFLTTSQGALKQLDPTTQKQVIISK
ncbi:hypothetical protein Q3O60_04615 [Alkalimonas collagenimarina]|uniref:Uncharacterized protein n=1 Tax=Alkalimonas collagenimarina TaxID=400390 RepID=A0ABT9GWN4_9GAMM|nr:hypothetical protein [Alkalimonas collagenimarina]MDP4535472.1 hypothetical protein [Alkalimonas collagenimarina]